MIYRVVKAFADSEDEMHVYQPGDIFRAENTSAKRLAQLMTSDNMVGCPLIVAEQEVAETVEPEKPKSSRKRGKQNAD